MVNRLIAFFSIIAAGILISMLFFTTPASIGAIGIFIFFAMSYVVAFGVMTFLVRIFRRLVFRKKEMEFKNYISAATLALWPILILFAISLGSGNPIVSIILATVATVLMLFITSKI